MNPNPSLAELEARLRRLGADGAFPPTPQIAAAVTQRLGAETRRNAWPVLWRRASYLAAVFVLACLLGLAVPEVRDGLAERLGLRGLRVVSLSGPPQGSFIDPRSGLGARLDLEAARSIASFPFLVPAELGQPDEVYISSAIPGGEVTLLYGPRAGYPESGFRVGLLVSQTPGQALVEVYEKGVAPGTTVRSVSVAGQPGTWISGAPHSFSYRSPSGESRVERARLASNVLLFERQGLIVRIEGAISLEKALQVASSLQ